MIDEYGTDAFRFSLAAFAAQGRDIRLSEERIQGYRNFANKIWNAARFTLMNLSDYQPDGTDIDPARCSTPDKWILARLSRTTEQVTSALDDYRFNDAAQELYHFVWHELCDWYLELSKPYLYKGAHPDRRTTTQRVLAYVFDNTLRLLHPFMPFISEEIWQRLPHDGESLTIAPYPGVAPALVDNAAARAMERVMGVITGVRTIRGEMGIPPASTVDIVVIAEDDGVAATVTHHLSLIKDLARVNDVRILVGGGRPRAAAAALAEGVEIFVPLEGLVADPRAEERRLNKELVKILTDLERSQKKLANDSFLSKAPDDVVQKERDKVAELSLRKEKVEGRLVIIAELGACS
jgi:valyl-tRNA synthetase